MSWKEVALEHMPEIGWDRPNYLALSKEVQRGVQSMAEEILKLRSEIEGFRIEILQYDIMNTFDQVAMVQSFPSSKRMLDEILKLKEQLKKACEALELFVLTHEHAPDLPHTRAMGDTYGWCDFCSTKVTWGDDPAKEALEEIRGG